MGSNWIYRPRELLDANSPSIQDGISAEREEAKRLAYTGLLKDCGVAMKIQMPTISVAAVFCHHFFAVKSMRTNDTWVVATACLFLACKVQEAPKALKDVIVHMWTMRHRTRVAELDCIKDREWQESVKAAVLKAERALLYVIGFDFRVTHPYQPALHFIRHFNLAEGSEELPQTTWDLVTLSWRTTLSLQLKPENIAVAAIFLAMKLLKMPPKIVDGRHWFLLPPASAQPQLVEVAAAQLLEVADKLRRFHAKRAAPKELVALLQQRADSAGVSRPSDRNGDPPAMSTKASAVAGAALQQLMSNGPASASPDEVTKDTQDSSKDKR